MAKKNSSKTATQEAIKASEPRLQTFTGWQGVNFKDSPLGWEWGETAPVFENHDYRHHQSDLKSNYLLIQNNVVTTDGLTLETRPDAEIIAKPPAGYKFTGVACLYHRWLFCIMETGSGNNRRHVVRYHDITDTNLSSWTTVRIKDAEDGWDPARYNITEIGYYQEKLIALAYHKTNETDEDDPAYKKWEGEIFTADLFWRNNESRMRDENTGNKKRFYDTIDVGVLESPIYVPDPTAAPTLRAIGMESNSTSANVGDTIMTTRVQVYYSYVNQYGSTLPSPGATIYTEYNPVTWSSVRYLQIKGNAPTNKNITGIDLYCTLDENSDAIYIGHVDLTNGGAWTYNWLGAMSDISQWTNTQLIKPTENNTKGVTARHFSVHDSRLYFWGDPERPYRLWIGGNPGAELSVARGLGGAFVDIEPGSGIEIHGTEKWKTTAGANIITMLCGNPNTNRVKRFNLVETSITVTNEISSKGYMYEEVSNVVGCNSRWGHGVFADGLYTVSRYGLLLTTMAMEYNAQMRNTDVSSVIQPIFTERLGERLNDARLVHIDEIIYVILSEEKNREQLYGTEPQSLDRVILCYDINAKAWYTFTHGHEGNDDGLLLHAMAIDSEEHEEGLGIISENAVTLYPTTGIQDTVSPKFDILIETGELTPRTPIQGFIYLCQLELRFDYLVGEAEVLVEGVDYYGRDFKVFKRINRPKYGKNPDGSFGPNNAEMRSHTEWIRIDKHVESYRIQIKGKARCRLTHINAKVYQDSARIGLPYGFDAGDGFVNRHRQPEVIHHYIKDYNNLRRAIVT